jgi:UDP-glucuronate 4-epimerase
MKILVTGIAGFIGFHLFKRLETAGHELYGADNINSYYDVTLKYGRLRELGFHPESIRDGEVVTNSHGNRFIKANLEDRKRVCDIFESEKFDYVFHIAAQPGVRYSIKNPYAYMDSNIMGFLNVIEGCRNTNVKHLVFASSSSVYGLNSKVPFNVHDNVDHPISLYAATKKSNELMAHCYSQLYDLPVTGLRLFTVYGPWGRPDMALFKFTKRIICNEPIDLYNSGNMKRDFTYVDDIVEGMCRVIERPPQSDSAWKEEKDIASSSAPYRIYNIGCGKPVALMEFVSAIEKAVGKKAVINFKPMQPGDVLQTWADTGDLKRDFDYSPSTSVQDGVGNFVNWYREFFQV